MKTDNEVSYFKTTYQTVDDATILLRNPYSTSFYNDLNPFSGTINPTHRNENSK